jgi:hypothetical protein
MGQTADELRQEIEAKRQDASDKIEQLEQKVTGATDQVMQTKDQILETKDQVKDQVMEVKDQVVESVAQAKDQVKEQVTQFDWRKQVDEKPLVALGAAFIGGVVLSSVLSDDDGDTRRYRSGIAPSYGSHSWAGNQASYGSASTYGVGPSYPSIGDSGSAARNGGSGMGLMGSIRKAARTSGFEDTVNNMTSSFMSTMTDRLRQMADEAFPGMGEKLQNVIEGMTGESDGSGSPGSTGGSSTSGSGSQASAGMGSGQGSTLGTSGFGTAASGSTGAGGFSSGSGGSVPSTSDYARTGELGSSLTNS